MKSKIKIELQKHIEENINVHEKLLEFSKDINELIEIIQKKLTKKYLKHLCFNITTNLKN